MAVMEALKAKAEVHALLERLDAGARPPSGDEPYSRRVLYSGPEGEAMLATWRGGVFCAPHDHGGRGGRVILLRGEFTERVWGWENAKLLPQVERFHGAGDEIQVLADAIHDMQGSAGALSLHLYEPDGGPMRVFDVANAMTLWVSERCGAWVPKEPSLVLDRKPW